MLKQPHEVATFIAKKQFLDTTYRIMGKRDQQQMLTQNYFYGKSFNPVDSMQQIGPRQQMLYKQYLDTIRTEQQEVEQRTEAQFNKRNFQTTFKQSYTDKNLDVNIVGRRRMKNMDGVPLAYNAKDQDLLVDHGFYQRKQITKDSILQKLLPKDQSYLVQQPITFWRQKVTDGCFYNSKKGQVPKNEFKRNNEFLKTFHQYNHEKG